MNESIEKNKTIEERLSDRVVIWESIIRDSHFSEGAKSQFLAIIEDRFKKVRPPYESMDDWIYFSISQLLIVVDKIAEKENISRGDLMALFENLRDDIWDFYKEINK